MQRWSRVGKALWGLLLLAAVSACQESSDQMVDQNGGTPGTPTLEVAITAPGDGQAVAQDAPISFTGTAALSNGAGISETQLVWTSDRDGVIGVGFGFTRSGLSVGEHTITLTATGPEGQQRSAQTHLTVRPSGTGMVVRIETPAGQRFHPYDLIDLRGSAVAPDGTPVTNPLAFEWRSNLETDPGPVLGDSPHIQPGGLTPGLHTITLTVTAPDGNGGTVVGRASIEVMVDFVNTGLDLQILAPFAGYQLVQGQELTCNGSAGQSGGGSFDQIVWTSSIDGEIGTSETCVVPYLSLGTHRITMTALASNGEKGAVSTLVEVVP